MRSSCCVWLEWDAEGRPRCEHGWAFKSGYEHGKQRYRCRVKGLAAARRWNQTDSGREYKRRRNNSDAQQSSRAIYELSRVRY